MHLYTHLILFAVLLLFSRCDADSGKSPYSQNKAENKELFKVRDHSLLLFRNLRLPFYQTEETVKNREFTYRITARTRNANYPLIQNAIHYDQHNSMAYLLLEPNHFFPEDSIHIAWEDPDSENMGEFYVRMDTPDFVLAGSRRIAEYLSNEYDLYMKQGNGQLQIFRKKNDKKQFLSTVNDFINLTSP